MERSYSDDGEVTTATSMFEQRPGKLPKLHCSTASEAMQPFSVDQVPAVEFKAIEYPSAARPKLPLRFSLSWESHYACSYSSRSYGSLDQPHL